MTVRPGTTSSTSMPRCPGSLPSPRSWKSGARFMRRRRSLQWWRRASAAILPGGSRQRPEEPREEAVAVPEEEPGADPEAPLVEDPEGERIGETVDEVEQGRHVDD